MKTNEELLYDSWMIEQIDHSKTIVVKDRLERQVNYVKQLIEARLNDEFEDVVHAIDALMERLES